MEKQNLRYKMRKKRKITQFKGRFLRPLDKIENFIKANKTISYSINVINGKKIIIQDADISDIEKNDI